MKLSLKSISIILFFLSIQISTIVLDNDEEERVPLDLAQLQAQSKECNAALVKGKRECISLPNCCYYESFSDDVEEYDQNCVGIDVFIKFYAKDEAKYMRDIKADNFHTKIRLNSFCEIIGFDPNIKDVKDCQCLKSFSKITLIAITWILYGFLLSN